MIWKEKKKVWGLQPERERERERERAEMKGLKMEWRGKVEKELAGQHIIYLAKTLSYRIRERCDRDTLC